VYAGEYWAVGVSTEEYDAARPGRYLRGLLHDGRGGGSRAARAFRSFVGVAPSAPPALHGAFERQVNRHIKLPPFNVSADLAPFQTVRLSAPHPLASYHKKPICFFNKASTCQGISVPTQEKLTLVLGMKVKQGKSVIWLFLKIWITISIETLVRKSITYPYMDFQKFTDINMVIHDFWTSVFNYPYKRGYPH